MKRRTFVKVCASVAALPGLPVMAGPFDPSQLSPEHPIPLDKKLDPGWIKSLYERGKPAEIRGWDELKYIGMPVGGIGAGTVYLGGDGRLWCWDIFNQRHMGCVPNRLKANANYSSLFGLDLSESDGANYVRPSAQESPWNIDQGFAIRMEDSGRLVTLDRHGFADICFCGEYPIGRVNYSDPGLPIEARLEALSPFVPLDTDSSSFPAVVMRFTVKNSGDVPQKLTVLGWLENPVLRFSPAGLGAKRICRTFSAGAGSGIDMTADSLLTSLADHGSMALLLAGTGGVAQAEWDRGPLDGNRTSDWTLVPGKLTGAVGRTVTLGPGGEAEAVFIIAWHFPNARILLYPAANSHRWYAVKFKDARAVAESLAGRLEELTSKTRRWRDCWYAGSLPHWFLERTLLTVDTLQTSTCFRFADGRFWAWEGVGCCHGTCTHVWHYAQAVARLFPDLERDLRIRTDYGIAFRPSDGMIKFRGEFERGPATDGQAGVILRTLREHQMSADDSFLREVWPRCKKALEFLISQDKAGGEPDGILTGDQPNTLDASWFGKIPSLSSLYLAALRAGEEMAGEMGDTAFASLCRGIYERGRLNILRQFDSQAGYFIQEEDSAHRDAIGIGRGCFIDQVIGQNWAAQAGLGRLYDRDKIHSALGKLWDYNFCPDMALVRNSIARVASRGRPYALAGDAGLVMCTWPLGGRRADWEKHWQYGYFNECMSGFEYQAAAHMIWEGTPELVERGLAVCRAIHDRYSPRLRNPYNEVECSDHYARAMASYGAFIAACGFTCHGPRGEVGFAPRLSPEKFQAAFTAATGWGLYCQERDGRSQACRIELAYGKLALRTISFQVPADWKVRECSASGPDKARLLSSFRQENDTVRLTLSAPAELKENTSLSVTIRA